MQSGFYDVRYQMYKVEFPYSTKTFVYFGSKDDAMREAKKYQKQNKYPYAPKIKFVKL